MAADVYKAFEGSMTDSEVAILEGVSDYTPASGRIFNIQGFWVYNSNTASKYGNFKVGTTSLSGDKQIPTKVTKYESNLNTPLLTTEKMYVKGEVADDLKYRIWGVEVDE
jgi:hypothetical protein